MGGKFRNEKSTFENIFICCTALVNFDIIECNNPLRNNDQISYKRKLIDDITEGKEKNNKISEKIKNQKEKRIKRFFELMIKYSS